MGLRLLTTLAGSASVVFALPASAQTWVHERSTPKPSELVAVDQTGEPSWLFGPEDIAGDGAANFNAAEQAADVRSAYAATLAQRLWLRVYVSARTEPAALRSFVFIDRDDDPNTGGPARAPEVDAALDADAAGAGYEIALAWTAANFLGVWRWTAGNGAANPGAYRPVTEIEPLHAATEGGTDRDPLGLSAGENGYVQLALDVDPIELSVRCAAKLAFRSSSGTLRDRDLGRAGACVPGDANHNGLSDVAEPDASCTSDAQCPAGGNCADGRCVAPALVLDPGDVVQGGALTCDVSGPLGAGRRWPSICALGVLLGASWLRRPRAGRDTC